MSCPACAELGAPCGLCHGPRAARNEHELETVRRLDLEHELGLAVAVSSARSRRVLALLTPRELELLAERW